MFPLVSVIVPTKNSQKYLARCLESITAQTYPELEIIVVDNFSEDKTRQIAKKFTNKVYQKAPERSAQVNFGAKKASGKYLYRVDADFVVDKRHVENMVKKCEQNNLDGILTFNRSDPSKSFWARVRNFERQMYRQDELILAARFFTKEIFQKAGGFNEKLVAFEDYQLQAEMKKAGGRFGRVETGETHWGEPESLWQIAKASFYYGRTSGRAILGDYYKHHPKRAVAQLQPFRGAFLKNLPQLLRRPFLIGGLIIYKTTAYLAAFCGFVFSFFLSAETAE